MEFYCFNWVQLSCDFGKVVPSGTTQGKVCRGHNYFFRTNLIGTIQGFIDISNMISSSSIEYTLILQMTFTTMNQNFHFIAILPITMTFGHNF